MAYGVSNGHVTDDVQLFSTDDVTWAQKVKVKLVTPIRLEPNISILKNRCYLAVATIANY